MPANNPAEFSIFEEMSAHLEQVVSSDKAEIERLRTIAQQHGWEASFEEKLASLNGALKPRKPEPHASPSEAGMSRWSPPVVLGGLVLAIILAVLIYYIYNLRRELDEANRRALNINASNVKDVVSEQIRERIRLHAMAYRILGVVHDRLPQGNPLRGFLQAKLKSAATGGKDVYPAFRFQEALASYLERQTAEEGIQDKILRMVHEGELAPTIDGFFLAELKRTLKESDLKRFVEATVMALVTQLDETDYKGDKTNAEAVPTLRRAISEVDFTKLLTAPAEGDFSDKDTLIADILAKEGGVRKGDPPYKGLGAAIKAKIAAKTNPTKQGS